MARIIPSNGVGNRPPQLDVGVGVALPFSGRPGGFVSTFSTQEQSRYNFINYLLTNHGERPFNPNFGANLRAYLFEQSDDELLDTLDNVIRNAADQHFPRVTILNVEVTGNDQNQVNIAITFRIGGTNLTDTINLQLNGQDI